MGKPQLVIMAAGMGSRYGGLKQLDSFGPQGERIIDYGLYDALAAGFERIVFVIRRDIETPFRESIGRVVQERAHVDYVFQELCAVPAWFSVPHTRVKPWGTGHAVACAAGVIDSPFAVINADDFYGRETFTGLFRWLSEAGEGSMPPGGCMAGFVLENTLSEYGEVSRGVCSVSPAGFLTSVVECAGIRREGKTVLCRSEDGYRELDPAAIVSMNTWGFTPDFPGVLQEHFSRFLRERGDVAGAEFYLPSVVNEQIAAGALQVTVLPVGSNWFGVTYAQDRDRVRNAITELVGRGDYPSPLWG